MRLPRPGAGIFDLFAALRPYGLAFTALRPALCGRGSVLFLFQGHAARQLTVSDYGRWDLLIGMDHANLRSMVRLFDGDRDKKCRLLLDYAGRSGQEISDPWYSGDFDAAWNDILSGCQSLLDALK